MAVQEATRTDGDWQALRLALEEKDRRAEELLRRLQSVMLQAQASSERLTAALIDASVDAARTTRELADEREARRADRARASALGGELARVREESESQAALAGRLEHALAQRAEETGTLSYQVEQLRRDLMVKDAYLAELRAALRDMPAPVPPPPPPPDRTAEIEQLGATVARLRDELTGLRADGARLAAELRQARQQLEHHEATLQLPRYRFADWLNPIVRHVPPIHRLIKAAVIRYLPSR